jgi:exopolysaccharide biosynthesis protein
MRRTASSLLIAAVMISSACFCQEDAGGSVQSRTVAPGITYFDITKNKAEGPLHINILKVDLGNRKISIGTSLANGMIGGLETTSSIAYRSGAIAAVNGSFFEARKKLHLPIGLMIMDGEVINRSTMNRATFGITKDKEIVFGIPSSKGYAVNLENKKSVQIWGINRPRKTNEAVIFTDEYGSATGTDSNGKEIVVDSGGKVRGITDGNSSIPRDGYVISLQGWSAGLVAKTKVGDRMNLKYGLEGKWRDVVDAISGGPFLIRDGRIVSEEIRAEKFQRDMLAPSSRTAIGVTADNKLMLVVVDKRAPVSVGVTYDELAEIMKEYGAVDAMGLDGGHASTMCLEGRVVNYPMWGIEAAVSNAVTVNYEGWVSEVKPAHAYTYIYVYEPPSSKLVEALKSKARLMPIAYVPQPEDYGTWGLYDIYNRVIKPVLPN